MYVQVAPVLIIGLAGECQYILQHSLWGTYFYALPVAELWRKALKVWWKANEWRKLLKLLIHFCLAVVIVLPEIRPLKAKQTKNTFLNIVFQKIALEICITFAIKVHLTEVFSVVNSLHWLSRRICCFVFYYRLLGMCKPVKVMCGCGVKNWLVLCVCVCVCFAFLFENFDSDT